MSFKRYASGAWSDIENVKRYSGGAWQDCESVKKYSGGVWVPIWGNESIGAFSFNRVYDDTGVLPTYEYIPNNDGCYMKVTCQNNWGTSNSELVLSCNCKLNEGKTHTISYVLGNKDTNISFEMNIVFWLYQTNASGLYELIQSELVDVLGEKSVTWTIPSGGVTGLDFILRVHGAYGKYAAFTVSSMRFDGKPVYFE